MEQNFIEDNVIMISKQTFDVLLKQENPADLISLYSFYYFTAKWQKTNQPKCTTSYSGNGLNWSDQKVRKVKKILLELGLIEDVQTKNDKGQIIDWYIKINYIFKSQSISQKNHPNDFPQGGFTHRVDNCTPNALRANNINALRDNSLNTTYELERLIEKWNGAKQADPLWQCARLTDNLVKVYSKHRKQFKTQEQYEEQTLLAMGNYFTLANKNPNFTHRFSLHDFLKQSNGYLKYINYNL